MAGEVITFEDAFLQLEEAVARLESGGLSVDDMVSQFEKGMTLVRLCRERLDAAQARVTVLTRADEDDGPVTLEPSTEDD